MNKFNSRAIIKAVDFFLWERITSKHSYLAAMSFWITYHPLAINYDFKGLKTFCSSNPTSIFFSKQTLWWWYKCNTMTVLSNLSFLWTKRQKPKRMTGKRLAYNREGTTEGAWYYTCQQFLSWEWGRGRAGAVNNLVRETRSEMSQIC